MYLNISFHVETNHISKKWIPHPCFLRDYTTWSTDDSLQMNASHWAIEEFYNNSTNKFKNRKNKNKCQKHQLKNLLSTFKYVTHYQVINH